MNKKLAGAEEKVIFGGRLGEYKYYDMDAVIASALDIECEPIRVDDYTGKKMTFFHDPDGLPLELHE